jgi:threonine/homoserine/homoserine lactone efflux protein
MLCLACSICIFVTLICSLFLLLFKNKKNIRKRLRKLRKRVQALESCAGVSLGLASLLVLLLECKECHGRP